MVVCPPGAVKQISKCMCPMFLGMLLSSLASNLRHIVKLHNSSPRPDLLVFRSNGAFVGICEVKKPSKEGNDMNKNKKLELPADGKALPWTEKADRYCKHLQRMEILLVGRRSRCRYSSY